MIEKIDKEVIPKLMKSGVDLIVTGDHSTPVSRKGHSGDPVPIMIYHQNVRTDSVKKFDEISCVKGGLGHILGKDLINIILNILKKGEKYGS